MRRALLFLLLFILGPMEATAQDVVLQHIPRGEILVVDGVEYMAYPLDLFREVAEVDLDLQVCLIREEGLRASLEVLETQRAELDQIAQDVMESNEQVLSLVETWEPPPPERESWFSWQHTPLHLALLGGWVTSIVLSR